MNVLVLGGCGIQGKGALFDLSKNPFVDRIIYADLDPESIHSMNYIQHDRIIPAYLNAQDKPATVSLMKHGDITPLMFSAELKILRRRWTAKFSGRLDTSV